MENQVIDCGQRQSERWVTVTTAGAVIVITTLAHRHCQKQVLVLPCLLWNRRVWGDEEL